jgi:hypothetical protein
MTRHTLAALVEGPQAVLKQIKVGPGLDGIMFDEPVDTIIKTHHSRPIMIHRRQAVARAD